VSQERGGEERSGEERRGEENRTEGGEGSGRERRDAFFKRFPELLLKTEWVVPTVHSPSSEVEEVWASSFTTPKTTTRLEATRPHEQLLDFLPGTHEVDVRLTALSRSLALSQSPSPPLSQALRHGSRIREPHALGSLLAAPITQRFWNGDVSGVG
jgi:hypothetical protein